jgi:hypothetical protein
MDVAGARNGFDRGVRRFNEYIRPQLREKFLQTSGGLESEVHRLLEHHARAFVLDQLLASLGWTVGQSAVADETNVLTEAFFKAASSDKVTNYLDYLGFDKSVTLPLMVFEAKRLGSAQPSFLRNLAASAQPAQTFHRTEDALAAAVGAPKWLKGEWLEHLQQLERYYRGVIKKFKQAPTVMAIGNGEWLVIILKPEVVFDGSPTADCFRVIEMDQLLPPGTAYLTAYEEIHQHLAHDRLAPAASFLAPESIPMAIRESNSVELMRGLRVGYTSTQTSVRKGPRPHLDVSPLVFLRLPAGAWVAVGLDVDGETMPHEGNGATQLGHHLQAVQTASDHLVARVRGLLKVAPVEVELSTHYRDGHSFASRPGVMRENPGLDTGTRAYLLVTGRQSHFLLPKPRVADCPYHRWSDCDPHAVGRHPPAAALAAPSYVGARAFFPDGRLHHCAAGVTHNMKSAQVNSGMQTAFGIRSAAEGGPFCELFDFESMLCCQTCVFFDVCAQAQAFKLPCMH